MAIDDEAGWGRSPAAHLLVTPSANLVTMAAHANKFGCVAELGFKPLSSLAASASACVGLGPNRYWAPELFSKDSQRSALGPLKKALRLAEPPEEAAAAETPPAGIFRSTAGHYEVTASANFVVIAAQAKRLG